MAEAISFRRGTTEENDQFIGVEGEIVVDLGSGSNALHTMNNNTAVLNNDTKGAPTVRFHLGNSQSGGVILARADMANIDTKALATKDEEAPDIYHKGKNLAYADLENIVYNSDQEPVVQDTLNSYGIAWKNTANVNTADLVNALIHNGDDDNGNKPLAYKDTKNINTRDLVDIEIHDGVNGNKPLSYADGSNINTSGLAERTSEEEAEFGKNLAYQDTTNVNTSYLVNRNIHTGVDQEKPNDKALLYYDMSNMTDAELKTRMDSMFNNNVFINGYERTSFKENTNILSNANNSNNYTSNNAVYNYVKNKLNNENYAKNTLNNLSSVAWDIASTNNDGNTYKLNTQLEEAGEGYQVDDTITTNVKILTDQPSDTYIVITVLAVQNGRIVEYKTDHDNIIFNQTYLTTDVEYTDAVKGGKFKFSRQQVICGALMKNNLSNSQIVENTDFAANIKYQYTTEDSVTKIVPTMMMKNKTTEHVGTVSCTATYSDRYDLDNTIHQGASTVAEISTKNGSDENKYGIFATEDGVYYISGSTLSFSRDNLVSTIGYCDKKQNTQNISVISSGTTINLHPQKAIYYIEVNNSAALTIDKSAVTVANNTAKTFEIYVKVGQTLPTITWSGIDFWLSDSEQTPLNTDTTSIFVIRIQNINGTTKVIANYGGEF